jgi:hypothetical protein
MDSGSAQTNRIVRRNWLNLLCAAALVAFAPGALAQQGEPKTISGMSIVGNDETPKSLYIVPWKSSELGVETSLTSSLLNDQMVPVDKEVFMRELDFYQLTQQH